MGGSEGANTMADADQYDEIRRRVEQRYKKRQELYIHIASYVITNLMLWFFFHDSWVLWVTFGWGIGVISNVIDYYTKYGPGAQRQTHGQCDDRGCRGLLSGPGLREPRQPK